MGRHNLNERRVNDLEELDITIKQISMCGELLNIYMVRHVEDHVAWADEPAFTGDFAKCGKEIFGEAWNDHLMEQAKIFACRMAPFLRGSYDEFRMGLLVEHNNICPECDAIHCFKFIAVDAVHWSAWCTNCNKLIACNADDEENGV